MPELKPEMILTRMLLPLFLLGLTGCATINDMYSTNLPNVMPEFVNDMVSDKPGADKSGKSGEIADRITDVDKANDRARARNDLIRDLISESDRACASELANISRQTKSWDMDTGNAGRALDEALETGIKQRKYDSTNPDMALNRPVIMPEPEEALSRSIAGEIQRQRDLTRNQIDERLEMGFRAYSLKQALLDLQLYHDLCSIEYGISLLSRAATQGMSPEEKQARIASLIELRNTLKAQGLNTRAVEQKIDAVITAD